MPRYRERSAPPSRPAPKAAVVRAAFVAPIYTRKSSEEGLEQSFNSLDAQRDACEAYIASQKHEGWSVVPDKYDDGGFSGGSMERPALRRLLEEVSKGAVDVVVVYKVDRLTRSLADFAKLTDLFERHGTSFVSVTQQFNTSTSMGRLTLNVLLSFAQFERELAGERIRDKIALSKRRGMWMGGLPPLGYDGIDRKLVVNETEAETVRHIFRRYLELGSDRPSQAGPRCRGHRLQMPDICRRPDRWRQAAQPRRRLSDPAQPALSRGDRLPGRDPSRQPRSDHRCRPLGRRPGAPRPAEPSATRCGSKSVTRRRPADRPDLRRCGQSVDADLRIQAWPPLPLLCLGAADPRRRHQGRHPCPRP